MVATDKMTVKTTLGLVASMMCCVFCGWQKSFNVISVDLKTNFNFTLTQVQLVASVYSAGSIAFGFSVLIIGLLGFKISYAIAIVLVTSSSLLLSWSVSCVEFVKDWTFLFAVLLWFNCSAYILAVQCCIGIGVLNISKRHTGKLICFYTAALSLGKSYYALVRKVLYLPGDLQGFFLTMSIPFVIVTVLCVFFHQEPVVQETECISEQKILHEENKQDCESNQTKPSEISGKYLLSSGILQLAVLSTSFIVTCALTFMNNLTIISQAVGFTNHEFLVYMYSISSFASKVICGVLIDFIGTIRGAVLLLYFSYIIFSLCMIFGFVWLNHISIFIITFIASLCSSPSVPVFKVMMIKIFAPKNYVFISGYFSCVNLLISVCFQLSVGVLYDKVYSNQDISNIFCSVCFRWVFLALFCLTALAFFIHTINIKLFLKSLQGYSS